MPTEVPRRQRGAREFTEKLVKRMSEYQLGNGLDDYSTLGPLISPKQLGIVNGSS